ncbi:MAG TPA: amidohydrolase family protein, partial [Dehalococcoidia bacterium]|nr:amidohydrolase family protein [Dehalococcoidia bacterium]
MPQIDMHSHIIPAEFPPAGFSDTAAWPRVEAAESGHGRVVVSGPVRYNAHELYYDRERRLENMAAHGIDAEVISPLPNLLNYTLPAEDGAAYCRALNEWILDVCHTEPRRFFGLGTLPMQDPDVAARELTALKQAGLAGVIVGSCVAGVSIADKRFLGVFQEIERLDLPVFVHTITPGPGEHLPQAAALTFGFAAEIALATAGLITGGTVEACPNLRIAISHGGGGFALMLARARYF